MAAFAAALLSVIKSVPAAERFFAQLVQLYIAWKLEQNAALTKEKDALNDAAVDAAVAAARAGGLLCATCPHRNAANDAGEQHGAAPQTPAIPSSGSGRT